MTITLETYLLVSLVFAVFAAVVAVGSSLVLGASFERLKIAFEVVQKQTGFFSDAIFRMEQRVDDLEKQDAQPELVEDVLEQEHVYITVEGEAPAESSLEMTFDDWHKGPTEEVRFH